MSTEEDNFLRRKKLFLFSSCTVFLFRAYPSFINSYYSAPRSGFIPLAPLALFFRTIAIWTSTYQAITHLFHRHWLEERVRHLLAFHFHCYSAGWWRVPSKNFKRCFCRPVSRASRISTCLELSIVIAAFWLRIVFCCTGLLDLPSIYNNMIDLILSFRLFTTLLIRRFVADFFFAYLDVRVTKHNFHIVTCAALMCMLS